ncbi:MAG: trehalose-phosphatase [Bdellovibrionia bacterium]
MNFLFSSASLRVLESLSFTDTLYAFDFDGTLAPIVDEPLAARMSAQTESLLRRFAEKVSTAVISGRSLSDLRPRVPSEVKYLIGNHGLEGIPWADHSVDCLGLCQRWKGALLERLKPAGQDQDALSGISLEDKEYSLALHFRSSRHKKRSRDLILKAIESLDGNPKVVPGKLVFNVVPAGGPHKGMAFSKIMSFHGASFGFYVGDDYTDEDVFNMRDHRVLTVNVGVRKDSQAQFYIRRQNEMNRLLRYLLKFHGIQS